MAKILIADADPALLVTICNHLAARGHSVTAVNDAISVRSHLAQEETDLLIADLDLPGQTGIELLRELQKEHRELGVIFTTAFGSVEDAVHAIRAGAVDFYRSRSAPSRCMSLLTAPSNAQHLCVTTRTCARRSTTESGLTN